MSVRFGVNPIGWSNDDDRSLGADISIEKCLHEAKEAGFEGIEKGHKMPSESGALGAVLRPYGLDFVSGWYSTNLLVRSVRDEIAAAQDHVRLLKEMGCKVCIVCETSNAIHGDDGKPLSERPVLPSGEWKSFCDGMTEFGNHLAGEGLTLVYHHHMGTITQSADDIDRLMDGCGESVKLLLDTGHATFAGIDPVTLARTYMSRTRHIHCKNLRDDVREQAMQDGTSFLEAVRRGVFTVPGDLNGCVDFESVLQIAADHRYDGWLVVEAEQDPAVANPLDYAKLGASTLKTLAGSTGLN
jgi:inosose dehydratase